MSMRKPLAAALLALSFGAAATAANSPKLGKPITEEDIAAWDIAAMPNGDGLPAGSGTAVQGAKVYAEKCSACHGDAGKGGPVARGPLFGGPPLTSSIDAQKTIGNFWGHATTVFDFTRRAMPFNHAAPIALGRRDLRHHRLHPVPQQDHRRERRDGRQDPAGGEDAEPRQLHHPVSGSDLNELVECGRPGAVGRRRARRRDRHAQPAGGQQRLQRRADPGPARGARRARRRQGAARRRHQGQRQAFPGRRRPEMDRRGANLIGGGECPRVARDRGGGGAAQSRAGADRGASARRLLRRRHRPRCRLRRRDRRRQRDVLDRRGALGADRGDHRAAAQRRDRRAAVAPLWR